MAATIQALPPYMMDEMNEIKKSLSQYPGHKAVASSLGKFVSQDIVAGLIGCIIPESGSNHTILNAKEYRGMGADGTYGWNCGEGLIQWTYWKYKLPLIKEYNADETRLEVIVAKIYQQKAGIGFYPEHSNDPVLRAYKTAESQYPSSAGNHYLQSLKIAAEYLNVPVTPIDDTVPVNDYSVPFNTYEEMRETPATPIIIESIGGNVKNRKNKPVGTILGSHMRQK